jgi:hypothetical protein
MNLSDEQKAKRDRFVALQVEMDAYDKEHNSVKVLTHTKKQVEEYNGLIDWFLVNPDENEQDVRDAVNWQRRNQSPNWPGSHGLQPTYWSCDTCHIYYGSARAYIYHFDHCVQDQKEG